MKAAALISGILCLALGAAAAQDAPRPARARRARAARATAPARSDSTSELAAQPRPSNTSATEPVPPARPDEQHPLLPIATLRNELGLPSGTPIQVQLDRDIDSASVHNGATVEGKLAQPLGKLPAGTPVTLTVVSAAPAGTITSYGTLSVQLIRVGGAAVLSDVISAQGQEGHKDLPDSAPAKGTEAVLPASQVLTLPAA